MQGTLANGLRYEILPHLAPRGGISLRLVVDAGSLDEHNDERGFAHFVEHMAFNGTRHHPPGTLTEMFQHLGLTWGADLNAETNYASTVYKLDLPEDRVDHLPEALQLLRDYADGLEFPPAEVEREKGVVLSELRARDLSGRRASIAVTRALYAGTPVADREVGGVPAQIEQATADALRGFYRRCYQPARMTVLVVGNVAPAGLARQIAGEFGSLAGDRSAPPAVEPALPPPAGLQAHVVVNPNAGAAAVSFIVLTARPPETPAGFREALVERVATAILELRLSARRQQELARYGSAATRIVPGVAGRTEQHVIEVQTAFARWPDAVGFAETELRRARTLGFDDGELKEAVAGILTQLQNRVAAVASAPSPQLALELTRLLVAHRSWRDPTDEARLATQELASLSTEEVRGELAAMFPDSAIHIILRGPRAPDQGAEALLAACRKSAGQPLPEAAAAAGETLAFRYGDFGPPGKLVLQRSEPDLGLELACFANGVQLNLRPSALERQRFRLRATLGRGLADAPKTRPGLARLAVALFGVSDLSRHPTPEISRLLRLHGVSFSLELADGAAAINLGGPAAELPFALQFVTALLSDLKLDAKRMPAAVSRYGAQVRTILSAPTSRANIDALYTLTANDPRYLLAASDAVAKYPFAEVADWLLAHWLQGPLEIGIVGDFQPAETVAAAAASVGTLAARGPRAPIAAAERIEFATTSGKLVYRTPLAAGAAAAFLAWPTALPDDPRNNRALQLAADVLSDRLRVKLRQELGATYSPHAGFVRNRRQPDHAYFSAALTFEPTSASTLTDRVVALADELAQHGVTDEELARLKEPRHTRSAEQVRDNAWWLGSVAAFAQSQPGVLTEARGHLAGYDELTRDDVNRAARALAKGAVTAVVVVPVPPNAPKAEVAPPVAATQPGGT